MSHCWKNAVYLKGQLGLALRLSPHNEGDDQTGRRHDTEDSHRPHCQASLDSYDAEDTHQNTWAGEEKAWDDVRCRYHRLFRPRFVGAAHRLRWCKCWPKTRTGGTARCLKAKVNSWWWSDRPVVAVCGCSPHCKSQPFRSCPGCWPSHRPHWAVQAGTFRWQNRWSKLRNCDSPQTAVRHGWGHFKFQCITFIMRGLAFLSCENAAENYCNLIHMKYSPAGDQWVYEGRRLQIIVFKIIQCVFEAKTFNITMQVRKVETKTEHL